MEAIALTDIANIGDASAKLFGKLGIFSSENLLFHLPRDYEDRSRIVALSELRIGQHALIEVTVQSVEIQRGKRTSMVVMVSDGSAKITLRFYHIYNKLRDQMQSGQQLRLFGELRRGARGAEMYHPEFQIVNDTTPLPKQQLTSIYPTTEGLTQAKIRQAIKAALKYHQNQFIELLPEALSNQYRLIDALNFIHLPPIEVNIEQLRQGQHPAQQRLILEELIAHQVSLYTRRHYLQQQLALKCKISTTLKTALLKDLSYQPTNAQRRVVNEIEQDLAQKKSMLRLVQGDVGSGKTLVAAMAACSVLENGAQVAIMAPTDLLAEQHFLQFCQWFEPLGISTAWLSGKQLTKQRNQSEAMIASGQAQLVIGTHALFQHQIEFKNLALVIIDEQHRFGVEQRLALRNKGGKYNPHQLIMTATPIPRTLAMSHYGDLDHSIINELPPGRTPVTTVTVPIHRRSQVIERVAENCKQMKQAYWVCTLVEESENLQAQAAEVTFQTLQKQLPELKLGLVHGRMKAAEKQQVMQLFKTNKIQLLISTTVIEVGVDVPNASLMVIENAERLGLFQLHQLRGRVGRGATASFCVLLYQTPLTEHATSRLSILRESNDGFAIADQDLQLRGPGEILGTRQTGELGFKVAHLQRDGHLLEQAQHWARQILQQNPQQAEALLQRWLPNAPRYIAV